jgi:catechol 2,3-dioxygenase-like lactoylglutathione lyase family enzyme
MTSETLHFRVENITPILSVLDMSRSLAFYVDILGFTNADWGDDNFTCVSRDKRSLYLCKGGQGSAGTWVWVGVDTDIIALHQSLLTKGITIKLPPTNYSWALEMHIQDPDGHVLRFGTEPNDKIPFMDK